MNNEATLIRQIADRAAQTYLRLGSIEDRDTHFVRTATITELMTVHREIIPLRLAELLAAKDFDFLHDIGGIHRHLDVGSQYERPFFRDGFTPRHARVQFVREAAR